MQEELTALQANHTYNYFPTTKKVSHWLQMGYRVKFLANGTIDIFKARLVAKGFTQQAGVDFLTPPLLLSLLVKTQDVASFICFPWVDSISLSHLDIKMHPFMVI